MQSSKNPNEIIGLVTEPIIDAISSVGGLPSGSESASKRMTDLFNEFKAKNNNMQGGNPPSWLYVAAATPDTTLIPVGDCESPGPTQTVNTGASNTSSWLYVSAATPDTTNIPVGDCESPAPTPAVATRVNNVQSWLYMAAATPDTNNIPVGDCELPDPTPPDTTSHPLPV